MPPIELPITAEMAPEPLGEEAIAACDHVVVAVAREVAREAVGRLARPAAAERVRKIRR